MLNITLTKKNISICHFLFFCGWDVTGRYTEVIEYLKVMGPMLGASLDRIPPWNTHMSPHKNGDEKIYGQSALMVREAMLAGDKHLILLIYMEYGVIISPKEFLRYWG